MVVRTSAMTSALFEIGDVVGFPGGLLGTQVQLRQQGLELSVDIVMGGGDLQVVPLFRVGHRAARERNAPRRKAALVICSSSTA